jgi:hypothetical protein
VHVSVVAFPPLLPKLPLFRTHPSPLVEAAAAVHLHTSTVDPGMATLERPREVLRSPDPLLTTAIPTPFPRALLQSSHTQQEDIVRPATAPAIYTADSSSTAERPIQTVQHEPTKGEMVSRLMMSLASLGAHVC